MIYKNKDQKFNSPAFNFLIDLTRPILPHGSFLPRLIRDRHVSDSLVLLVGILGLALLSTALSLLYSQLAQSKPTAYFYGVLLLAILGSVFFFVGSQNAIRQFVGTCSSVLVRLLVRASVLVELLYPTLAS